MKSESRSSLLKSQVQRMLIGGVAAAAALWGAWHVSNGAGGDGGLAKGGAGEKAGELNVDVSGVRSDQGAVIGSLCHEGQQFPSGCGLRATSKAGKGVVTLRFSELPEGDYALALFHDENGNGQMELGTEGIGFSNNANLAHATPEFDASRIKVSGMTRIRVRIRYSI
jgi:uncharacterized protein (DUF2141 family)